MQSRSWCMTSVYLLYSNGFATFKPTVALQGTIWHDSPRHSIESTFLGTTQRRLLEVQHPFRVGTISEKVQDIILNS